MVDIAKTVEPVLSLEDLADQRRQDMATVTDESLLRTIRISVDAIKAVLEKQVICAASSSGKDSSVTLSMVLLAAEELHAEGKMVNEIHVTSSNTGTESPEVLACMIEQKRAVDVWSKRTGLHAEAHMVGPGMSGNYLVRIIGGRKLPSYINTSSDCSVDLKVSPQDRFRKRLAKRLKDEDKGEAVTCIGTRFDESARRSANMSARGESSTRPIRNSQGHLVLSPISHWTTGEVFYYLAVAGRSPKFPCFRSDWDALLELYGDAAGDGCMLVPDPNQTARSKGCGSRFGCWSCTKVAKDKSAENLLSRDGYEYLRPLMQFRDFLANIQYDFSRRRWVGRTFHKVSKHIQVFPNCFNAETTELMLRALLSMDQREKRRAAAHKAAFDRGEIRDNVRNRRLCEPQFETVPMTDLIAIDYLWATDHFHPPFHALHIWNDVVNNGNEIDVPVVEMTPRPAKHPQMRWLAVDQEIFDKTQGLRDFSQEAVSFEPNGSLYEEDILTGEISTKPWYENTDTWTVDAEAVGFILGEELESLLSQHGAEHYNALHAAYYYLRMGAVTYIASMKNKLDDLLRRGQYFYMAGLTEGRLNMHEILPKSISDAEHKALCEKLEAAGDYAEDFLEVATDWAGDYRFALARTIGLQAAIAELSVSDDDNPWFDGYELKAELKKCERAMKRCAKQLDESKRVLIHDEVVEQAIALIEGMRLSDHPQVEPGFGVFLAVGQASVDVGGLRRTLQSATYSHSQMDLFSVAA